MGDMFLFKLLYPAFLTPLAIAERQAVWSAAKVSQPFTLILKDLREAFKESLNCMIGMPVFNLPSLLGDE